MDDNKTDVTVSVDCYYIFSAPKLRVRGRSLRMKIQEKKEIEKERSTQYKAKFNKKKRQCYGISLKMLSTKIVSLAMVVGIQKIRSRRKKTNEHVWLIFYLH